MLVAVVLVGHAISVLQRRRLFPFHLLEPQPAPQVVLPHVVPQAPRHPIARPLYTNFFASRRVASSS